MLQPPVRHAPSAAEPEPVLAPLPSACTSLPQQQAAATRSTIGERRHPWCNGARLRPRVRGPQLAVAVGQLWRRQHASLHLRRDVRFAVTTFCQLHMRAMLLASRRLGTGGACVSRCRCSAYKEWRRCLAIMWCMCFRTPRGVAHGEHARLDPDVERLYGLVVGQQRDLVDAPVDVRLALGRRLRRRLDHRSRLRARASASAFAQLLSDTPRDHMQRSRTHAARRARHCGHLCTDERVKRQQCQSGGQQVCTRARVARLARVELQAALPREDPAELGRQVVGLGRRAHVQARHVRVLQPARRYGRGMKALCGSAHAMRPRQAGLGTWCQRAFDSSVAFSPSRVDTARSVCFPFLHTICGSDMEENCSKPMGRAGQGQACAHLILWCTSKYSATLMSRPSCLPRAAK